MLTQGGEWWPDVLDEHLEELETLWTRRLKAIRSPEWSGRALAKLDDRIEAHTDALTLAGEEALPVVLPGLGADAAPTVAAAALPLGRIGGGEAVIRLGEAFVTAEGERLEGLRIALCQLRGDEAVGLLERAAAGPGEEQAAAAVVALAFRGRLRNAGRVSALMQSPSAAIRAAAWETVALLGPRTAERPGAEALTVDLRSAFRYGFADRDPLVRQAARVAAVWTRQWWLLDALREMVGQPSRMDVGALHLFAMLARGDDVSRVRALAANPSLGPKRCAVLASLGQPAVMEDLLDAMESGDAATAVAAGAAFLRMTGIGVGSGEKAALEPEGEEGDEVEREFQGEVELPSAAMARSAWVELGPRLRGATRLCRGLDVSRGVSSAALGDLDRESLWELRLRGCYEKTWEGGQADLERLPQLAM